jgi:integrase
MADKAFTAEDIKKLEPATRFTSAIINSLEVPATGSRFYGFSGATYKDRSTTHPLPAGLSIVVTANGVRSFVLNYLFQGRERRIAIAKCHEMTTATAIAKAKGLREDIAKGVDPLAEREAIRKPKTQATTVADIFARWLVSPGRSGKSSTYQRGSFTNHILPAIGSVPYRELRKSQVADMYDDIADTAGPVAANRAVSYLAAVLNWREGRDDDWSAPNLRKIKGEHKETARDRVLKDDELRALWPVWEETGAPGQLCRLLLLTGCRRSEIADLSWREIDLEGSTATIPAARYKTGVDHVVPLSAPALAILDGIPQRHDGRVFPVWSFARAKDQIDAKLAIEPKWTFHDLRRTAKTLMARNGVLPHISERVLGHAQAKIEGTYDQHGYLDEKREAVEKLARAVERILNPEPAKVVPLRA